MPEHLFSEVGKFFCPGTHHPKTLWLYESLYSFVAFFLIPYVTPVRHQVTNEDQGKVPWAPIGQDWICKYENMDDMLHQMSGYWIKDGKQFSLPFVVISRMKNIISVIMPVENIKLSNLSAHIHAYNRASCPRPSFSHETFSHETPIYPAPGPWLPSYTC